MSRCYYERVVDMRCHAATLCAATNTSRRHVMITSRYVTVCHADEYLPILLLTPFFIMLLMLP